jgi:hypothetical protein
MVTLEVEPSLVRVRDSTVGLTRVVADNRTGREWAQIQLKGTDPERLVRVTWASQELRVPPGGTAETEAQFEASLPEAGTEVSRTVTLSATDGRRISTATATFVQSASPAPMTTLALRIEPSTTRVNDADAATVQVTIDNRRGRSGVRIVLDGSDPERAIRFTFSPRVVDLSPGQVGTVQLRLDSRSPRPGQERTRQFAVTASDGNSSVEASGSLVQTSSRAATWRMLRKIAVAVIAGAVIAGAIWLVLAIVVSSRVPTITLSPVSGPVGTQISVSGTDFRRREQVEIDFESIQCGIATTDNHGAFTGFTCTVTPQYDFPGVTFKVRGTSRKWGVWATADFTVR